MYDLNNVETKYLFLNSSNASSGNNYDFQFVFNNPSAQQFFNCDQGEIVKLTPLQAIIPNDWDEIDSTNNAFRIILPAQVGNFTYNYAIPGGSPNILGLVQRLNDLFATPIQYWNGVANVNLTITVTFSTLYNVLVFALSATPSTITIDLNIANSAYLLLGFTKASYTYTAVNNFSSDFVPDISRLSEIYIYSSVVIDNYSQYNNDSYSNLDNTNILFSFPITASTGSNVIFQNAETKAFEQIIRNNLDRLDIQIRDKNGNYVIVNSPSTFCFKVDKYRGPQAVQEIKSNRVLGLLYK
jgi:hypothetical protein